MRRRRSRSAISVWPGFVDALSALLMVVIFMLLIYTMTQLYLSQTLSDRDSELAQLNNRLAEIARQLRLEEEQSEALAAELSRLRSDYQATRAREADLETEVDSLQEQVDADRERIQVLLGTQASLQQDIMALRELRDSLEREIAELDQALTARDADVEALEETLGEREAQLGALRDRSQALRAELDDQRERTLLAQEELEDREVRIEDLVAIVEQGEQALEEEQQLSASQRAQIERLNEQISTLQDQLQAISAALRLQESVTQARDAELAELGERLNTLLADRVSQLERYQSEFFGRLREVLEDSDDVRIDGDRFLLPSELLFGSGSANVEQLGQDELDKLADLVVELTSLIPDDIDWVLRVDGHTDRIPISTAQFSSNWELSTARALAVVQYLAEQGVPENRLVAAGFGEHYPVDEGMSEEALQRNRRIELKLTNR